MTKRGSKIEKFHRRQARLETRDQLKPTIDKILLEVLPPDHPERKRIERGQ